MSNDSPVPSLTIYLSSETDTLQDDVVLSETLVHEVPASTNNE